MPRTLTEKDLPEFLKEDTPFRSWFLGWVMTDGYVGKNGVSLGITDKEVIDSIIRRSNCVTHIYEEKRSLIKSTWKNRYIIRFNRIAAEKLNSFGFPLGVKSGKEFIPTCVSDKTFSHFLRGTIEGDGSIIVNNGRVRVNISSMSKLFLEDIINRLKKLNLVWGNMKPATAGTIYSVVFAHGDSQRICTYMYENSEGMRLTRKYERFIKTTGTVLSRNLLPEFCTLPECENRCYQRNLCHYHYFKKYKNENREKIKGYSKTYSKEHKDQISKKEKEYRRDHHEERLKKDKYYREKNGENIREQGLKYYYKNRDKILEKSRNDPKKKQRDKNYYERNKKSINLKRKEQRAAKRSIVIEKQSANGD